MDAALAEGKSQNSLLLGNKNDPFLDSIVTFDEKWILYGYRRRSAVAGTR
jgi:hypothetical protein